MSEQPGMTLPNAIEQTFAVRMIELRQQKGWSQSDLSARLWEAHQVKLNTAAITRMEAYATGEPGPRAIRLGEAAAIADVLETTLTDMLSPTPPAKVERARAELAVVRADEQVAHTMAAWVLAGAQAHAAHIKLLQLMGRDVSDLLEGDQRQRDLVDRTSKQAEISTQMRKMVESGELDYRRPLAEQGFDPRDFDAWRWSDDVEPDSEPDGAIPQQKDAEPDVLEARRRRSKRD